jgi:aldose 1-epimerase
LPVTLGFHPWFAREIGKGDSAELSFQANKMFKRSSDQIPSGELIPPSAPPWDDTFVETLGTPEIIWPGAARVTVESDTPYWHIYDQDEDGICIEPVTAPPDAQNLKIQGESYIECLITFSEDF